MTARSAIFQLHWLFGITAGFVLAIMGVTGALIAFEDEIMTALSPGVVTAPASTRSRLSPDALIAAALAQNGGGKVARLTLDRDPALAPLATFVSAPGTRQRGRSYIDPYSGRLLGPATGTGFFRFVNDLHRWLAIPNGRNNWARQITGASAIAMVFFALSGLYLRWPRRALDWRSWLRLDLRKRGRNLHRELHVTIGTWLIPFYLLSGLTGLWWSYDWYHDAVHFALTGRHEAEKQGPGEPNQPMMAFGPTWRSFLATEGHRYQRALILFPSGTGPIVIRMLPVGARFDRMHDELSYAPASGRLESADRYADRSVAETVASNIYALHTGSFFGLPGRIVMLATSLTMPLFTVTGLLLYLCRRRTQRAARSIAGRTDARHGPGGVLVVHASQTGTAERLAWLTADAFDGASVRALSGVTLGDLRAADRVLFVAATYGEGDPPDAARHFSARMMTQSADLAGVDYAMLALGDREYDEFCAFGHDLAEWLSASGARALFPTLEIDGDDAVAEGLWFDRLRTIGGIRLLAVPRPEPFAPWPLVERTCLNPGSPGGPVYRVALSPPQDAQWRPGAIVEILPGAQPLGPEPPHHRDYSIASIADSGLIELVVRQCRDVDGRLGLGSGWLTEGAALGAPVQARLRANPGFAPPDDPATPLVLIGNGTGIAGLMAHLRHRQWTGGAPVWLLFGERSAAHDHLLGDELDALGAAGVLTDLDRAFSRDAACGRYVQQLVIARAETIAAWAAWGAAFYVCGSLSGMAPAVDAALREILGDDAVEKMMADRRYCRDVY